MNQIFLFFIAIFATIIVDAQFGKPLFPTGINITLPTLPNKRHTGPIFPSGININLPTMGNKREQITKLFNAFNKRQSSGPTLEYGPYPVGETRDFIARSGANGGQVSDSWTFIPYYTVGGSYGQSHDPTMGGLGRNTTFTYFYPANSSYIDSNTPKAARVGFLTAADWAAVGLPTGYDSVPAARGDFPKLFFSAGFQAPSWVYSSLGYYFASHGIVVSIAEMSPGEAPNDYINSSLSQYEQDISNGTVIILNERALDMRLSVERLSNRSSDPSDILYGVASGSTNFFGGHSYGGLTAILAANGGCIRNLTQYWCLDSDYDQASALLLFDPSDWQKLWSDLVQNRLPVFTFGSKQSAGVCGWRSFHASRTGLSTLLHVNNSIHLSFAPDICKAFLLLVPPQVLFFYFPQCAADPSPLDHQDNINSIVYTFALQAVKLFMREPSSLSYFNPNCAHFHYGSRINLHTHVGGVEVWNGTDIDTVNNLLAYGTAISNTYELLIDGFFRFNYFQTANAPMNCSLA